jgi:Xaa-Pro aminopeptidase
MDHKRRLLAVQAALEARRLNALFVTHLPNIRYLCGFTGSAGVLLISAREKILFTDGRYTLQANSETHGARVKITKIPALMAACDFAKSKRLRRIGIESDHITVAQRSALMKRLGRTVTLIAVPPIVEPIRMIKDADEISRIRTACHLGVNLFQCLLKALRPGTTESEAAGELELAARRSGAEQMSFPTIIAGGPRSALPHGRASTAILPSSGFVVCDFGVILAGYCSDMTRTVHLGAAEAEQRAGYEAVREAQQAALDAVKPGATVAEVDGAARKLLYNRKFGKYFTHSTGHGLGLEIHEAPRIAATEKQVLQPGMVVTIEPGVYLPGRWGVRIEDTVVVTGTGCEILTPCPKDLLTL